MDPDTDSSILSSSIHPDSTEGSKKVVAYTTWAHTRPARDREEQSYKGALKKYYIYYTIEPIYGTLVTINMWYYLKAKY